MAGMSICDDYLDINILYEPGGLYLKHIIHLEILVMFPSFKTPGSTISNWEIMEKLKELIAPNKFLSLRVLKTLMGGQVVDTQFKKFNLAINNEPINPNQYEFLLLEAELDNSRQASVIVDILNGKYCNFLTKDTSLIGNKYYKHRYSTIKLPGISSPLKVRASHRDPLTKMPSKCYNIQTMREKWLTYFGSDKKFYELKPGHRPDTVLIQDLPCKWFSEAPLDTTFQTNMYLPNEKFVYKVFSRYGAIRAIHIPLLEQLSDRIGDSFNNNIASTSKSCEINPLTFEVYIQYMEFDGFERAMTALISSKLLYNPFKESTAANNYYTTYFKCDFDRNKHMSQSNIKRRAKLKNESKSEPHPVSKKDNPSSELLQLHQNTTQPGSSQSPTKVENIKNCPQIHSSIEQNSIQQQKTNCDQNALPNIPQADSEEFKRKVKKREKQQALARQKVLMEERKLILTQRKLESNRMLKYLFSIISEKTEMKLKEEAIAKKKEERAERKANKAKRKESKLQKKLLLEEHRLRQKLLRKMRNKMKEKLQNMS